MSILDLLKATGYFELHDQISVNDIRNALARDPACVQEWMQYSEDQRCPGWYPTLNDEDLYEVGFFDDNADPHYSDRVQYESAIDACAVFIKHEIERVESHVIEDIQKHEETAERKRALNRKRERSQIRVACEDVPGQLKYRIGPLDCIGCWLWVRRYRRPRFRGSHC